MICHISCHSGGRCEPGDGRLHCTSSGEQFPIQKYSETTVQKLRFKHYDSETMMQKLNLSSETTKTKQRFRSRAGGGRGGSDNDVRFLVASKVKKPFPLIELIAWPKL